MVLGEIIKFRGGGGYCTFCSLKTPNLTFSGRGGGISLPRGNVPRPPPDNTDINKLRPKKIEQRNSGEINF